MIAVSSSGKSFRALATYLAAGRSGKERDRVEWSAGRNLPTNDPEIAAKIMRATALQSQRVEVPVYHLTISFDPEDRGRITRPIMERVADEVLGGLGLKEHQAVYVAHKDRKHPHVHIMVNRVHPETGRAWERWKDQPTIQRVLREQERALGLTIVPGRLAEVEGHPAPRQPALTNGELRQAKRTGEPAFIERVLAHVVDYRAAKSWRDLEALLAQDGLRLERKGQGLIITDGVQQVKASRVARDLSFKQLETRFGVPYVKRDQEQPVSAKVARVVRDLRMLDRSESEASAAYQTRLAATGQRSRLAATEAAIERFREASAKFDRGLRKVYHDSTAARQAFDRSVAAVGHEGAVKQLVKAPEQFGPLRTEGLVFKSDRQARAAALELRPLAEAVARTGKDAPAPYDLESLRAALRRLDREHKATQDSRVRLPGRTLLEASIRRTMTELAPVEVLRLKQLLTPGQFLEGLRMREAIHDVLLGREVRERA